MVGQSGWLTLAWPESTATRQAALHLWLLTLWYRELQKSFCNLPMQSLWMCGALAVSSQGHSEADQLADRQNL